MHTYKYGEIQQTRKKQRKDMMIKIQYSTCEFDLYRKIDSFEVLVNVLTKNTKQEKQKQRHICDFNTFVI